MPFNGIRNIREHKGHPAPRHPSMSSKEPLVQRGTCGRQPQSDCTVGLPKWKPLTQLQSQSAWTLAGSKCPGWWESLLLRQAPSLGWQHCIHWPRCPGWRFCNPLTLKGHSQVQGQTHGAGSLGLGRPLNSCICSIWRESCPFYTIYDISSHTDYKSLKYPFSFLDVETDNMRGNWLKWMLEDKKKCPTSTDVNENSFPILFIVCVCGVRSERINGWTRLQPCNSSDPILTSQCKGTYRLEFRKMSIYLAEDSSSWFWLSENNGKKATKFIELITDTFLNSVNC